MWQTSRTYINYSQWIFLVERDISPCSNLILIRPHWYYQYISRLSCPSLVSQLAETLDTLFRVQAIRVMYVLFWHNFDYQWLQTHFTLDQIPRHHKHMLWDPVLISRHDVFLNVDNALIPQLTHTQCRSQSILVASRLSVCMTLCLQRLSRSLTLILLSLHGWSDFTLLPLMDDTGGGSN
jgi:hypothetical protein